MSLLFGSQSTTKSSTTPTLTGQGQDLYSQLLNFGSGVLSDPTAGLKPIQEAGEASINQNYGNIPNVVMQSLAKRGYGSSGVAGEDIYQAQLGRLGSISNLQGQIAQMASSRQFSAADLMSQLLKTQVGSQGTSQTNTIDPGGMFEGLGSLLTTAIPGGSILGKLGL